MTTCVTPQCGRPALASWWLLCTTCSSPLLDVVTSRVTGGFADQLLAAGWDALEWAERIAPNHWGHGSDDDWLLAVRCLALASIVSGRSAGCAHTSGDSDAVGPVVALPSQPGMLGCPACAEPAVASASLGHPSCDRCRIPTHGLNDRTATVVGAGLIVVAHLCGTCRSAVQAFGQVERQQGDDEKSSP